MLEPILYNIGDVNLAWIASRAQVVKLLQNPKRSLVLIDNRAHGNVANVKMLLVANPSFQ